MQVETYECNETAAEPFEACEEAVGLIESLGLDGQKGLNVKDDIGRDVRCPYREMTKDEQFAYSVLCPQKTDIKRYDAGPIPLRVLQIASHAAGLDVFRRLIVWHAASAAVPDPVLVGMMPRPSDSTYEFYDRPFILARWAESLDAFVTVLKTACEKKRRQLVDQINAANRQVAHLSGVMDGMTDEQVINCGADAAVEIKVPRWDG